MTRLDTNNDLAQLNQLHSVNWTVYFDPNNLFHHKKSGRLYYLFENKQLILDDNNQETHHSISRIRKQYSHIPVKGALVKSTIGIDLLKTIKPIEDAAQQTKSGNEYMFEYKSKPYVLNSNTNCQTYEMIKQFSSCSEHVEEK